MNPARQRPLLSRNVADFGGSPMLPAVGIRPALAGDTPAFPDLIDQVLMPGGLLFPTIEMVMTIAPGGETVQAGSPRAA
jgi:hypothetical protein